MRLLKWTLFAITTAQLSIIDLFQPQALGLLVSTMLTQFESLARESNLVEIENILSHIGEKSNEDLIELFNDPVFESMSNPHNWDYNTLADLLGAPMTSKQLRDGYQELLELISANEVDELTDAFVSLIELVNEAQNVLENGFNVDEIIAIGFDMLNSMYNFNVLFRETSFDTYLIGVGSYIFLGAEKYLLVTNEIEDSQFGENIIQLYENITAVQDGQGVEQEEFVRSVCVSLNKGIFGALDDLKNFILFVLAESGSDIDYLIDYWNQLISNLPYDSFLTISLYDRCNDFDILNQGINAVDSKLSDLIRTAKLISWPFYPLLGILQISIIEGFESASGYNCNLLI